MNDSDVVGCIGILTIAGLLVFGGIVGHAQFHTCPSEIKPEMPEVTHTLPTGIEVEWSLVKSNNSISYRCGILKDHDRNLQWRFVYIGSTITILPDSQRPITTPEKTK